MHSLKKKKKIYVATTNQGFQFFFVCYSLRNLKNLNEFLCGINILRKTTLTNEHEPTNKSSVGPRQISLEKMGDTAIEIVKSF